jgi:hypothetical protein
VKGRAGVSRAGKWKGGLKISYFWRKFFVNSLGIRHYQENLLKRLFGVAACGNQDGLNLNMA